MALGISPFETLPDNLILSCFQKVLDQQSYEVYEKKHGRYPDMFPYSFPELDTDKKPLAMLAQVCKSFRALADDEILWEGVRLLVRQESNLSFFRGGMHIRRTEWIWKLELHVEEDWEVVGIMNEIESAEWFDERVVDLVHHNCPNLEDLTITFIEPSLYSEEGKGLVNLSLHLPKLIKFRIDGAQKLDSIYLACPKLESLSITGICKLRCLDLQRNSALQLRTVNFTNVFIPEQVLQSFIERAGKSIISFSLRVWNGVDNSNKFIMEGMQQDSWGEPPFLESSDLSPIVPKILALMGLHMPQLESLSLDGNELVPLAFRLNDLAPLAKGCPKLRSLAIRDIGVPSTNVTSVAHGQQIDHTYWGH
jgi:hypothetical protein